MAVITINALSGYSKVLMIFNKLYVARKAMVIEMALFEVDDSNFNEEVLSAKEDVLVDFYATWCMPWKMLSPVVDKIAENMKVCKVNIDEARKSVSNYMIVSVPTLIAFRNGEEINRLSGVTDEEEIMKLFK